MALWMTREVKMIKIYTDNSYVKYIFDKVQDNKLNKENNLDIINEIKMIINDRNKKEHITPSKLFSQEPQSGLKKNKIIF